MLLARRIAGFVNKVLQVVCRALRARCLSVRVACFVGGLASKHGQNAFQSTKLGVMFLESLLSVRNVQGSLDMSKRRAKALNVLAGRRNPKPS